jgi:pseudouridylate synthase
MTTPELIAVGTEVRQALAEGTGVVALETSVIGQGLPPPRNEECARRMTAAIRAAGAVPAWVGVVEGELAVGLGMERLARFYEQSATTKVARRDLPAAVSARALGATTVSATIWAAARAGVRISATGGVGGVHPGEHGDVSADLWELARTPGMLVCSGPKSIVDPAATAERLDELGVALVGYRVHRLPFFLAAEAPVELDHRVENAGEAASMLAASLQLATGSTVLVCNRVPESFAMPPEVVASAAAEAERRADAAGIAGAARTPFLLRALSELTDGASLEANLALLEANAALAGEIAVAHVAAAGPAGA